MQLQAVLHSKRARSARAVTMLVPIDAARLQMLPELCATWSGVLSVAAHVVTLSTDTAATTAAGIAGGFRAVQAVQNE